MTRTQLACTFLLASAFVLAAMLVFKLTERNTAEAGMVLPGNEYVFMTARTQNNEDSLLVLDKRNHLLLVYGTDFRVRGTKLEPRQAFDLRNLLGSIPNAGGNGGPREEPDPRVPR